MSKMTATRFARKFIRVEAHTRKDAVSGVISHEPEMLLKRSTILPAQDREERPCHFCGMPMMVSAGQHARYHKVCRKKKRSRTL